MADCGCGGGGNCITKKTSEVVALSVVASFGPSIINQIYNSEIANKLFNSENLLIIKNVGYLGVSYLYENKMAILPIVFGVGGYMYWQINQGLKPFALDLEQAEDFGLIEVETAQVMIGDNKENNLLIADSNGSKIWAKGGLNFMQASEEEDIFYFSLCNTKVIDNKVSVIADFDAAQDKLKFFCTKHQIQPADISISHFVDSTCVEVKGAIDKSVICLTGDIDMNSEDIVITTLGDVKAELGLEE